MIGLPELKRAATVAVEEEKATGTRSAVQHMAEKPRNHLKKFLMFEIKKK